MTARRLAGVLVAAAALVAAASPATAPAKTKKRADLVVSKGTVGQLAGRLGGSFTVKNQGNASAGKSTASITVKVSKTRRVAVKRYAVAALAPGNSLTLKVSAVPVPRSIPAGSFAMQVCTDSAGAVRERSDSNNCRSLGKLQVKSSPTPTPTPAPTSSVPPKPIPFTADTRIAPTATSNYWMWVPADYDATHQTPTTLFVWMHGCGGEAGGDLYNVAPYDGGYIAISLGGRDGTCWDVNSDPALVLAAVADVKSHFNINPRRVILGGYSSGGDLAYRTIFYNAGLFAGILAQNTAPFRDTGSSQSESIGAAAWKFNVVHLAQTGDDTYPIDTVRSEVQALKDAGFPATLVERPGGHYDGNTDGYTQSVLLPFIKTGGWRAP